MSKDEYIEYLRRQLYRRTKIAEEWGKQLGIKAYKFGALKTYIDK